MKAFPTAHKAFCWWSVKSAKKSRYVDLRPAVCWTQVPVNGPGIIWGGPFPSVILLLGYFLPWYYFWAIFHSKNILISITINIVITIYITISFRDVIRGIFPSWFLLLFTLAIFHSSSILISNNIFDIVSRFKNIFAVDHFLPWYYSRDISFPWYTLGYFSFQEYTYFSNKFWIDYEILFQKVSHIIHFHSNNTLGLFFIPVVYLFQLQIFILFHNINFFFRWTISFRDITRGIFPSWFTLGPFLKNIASVHILIPITNFELTRDIVSQDITYRAILFLEKNTSILGYFLPWYYSWAIFHSSNILISITNFDIVSQYTTHRELLFLIHII